MQWITYLEGFDERLVLIVPQVDVPVVERGEHPRVRGVQVDALDAVRAGRQPALQVEPEGLKINGFRW